MRVPGVMAWWCRAGVLAAVLWVPGLAHAAGTDVVRLADGDSIRGQVVQQSPDGTLLVAVRRAWLEQAHPRLSRQAAANEAGQTRAALEQLSGRIDSMLAAPPGRFDESLLALLRREQTRVTGMLEADAATLPQFIWLSLPGNRVRGVERAEPAWRQLVQWGWHEDLDRVETLSQRDLARALEERGVDPGAPPPSLVDRLPPSPQSDDQWQARVALLEDAYGKSVTFQGTGDIVVRSDQEVTIEALLPVVTQMLSGDVGGLLGLLGGGSGGRPAVAEDRWLASARRQAGSDGHFRATRVQTKPEQGVVDVESAFEVQLADGTWATVWRDQVRVDATQPRAGLEERIAGDPRVGQALQAIKAFGAIDEAALTEAIRFGAATMEAQEGIDMRFAAFRSDHTLRLDSPPPMVVRQQAARP